MVGVRDLIAKYEKYAKILRERLKELAEKEIGAKLELEYSQMNSTQIELVATITQDNASTDEIWRDLAFGRMQSIQTIIADPDQVPNGFVVREGSSVTQISQSSKGLSFSSDFLGDAMPKTVNSGEWTANTYRKEQQKIATLAKRWVPTKEGLFVPDLHPRLVTLLRLMLAMDNNPAPSETAGLAAFIDGLSTPLVSDPADRRIRISMRLGNESVPTYF
ncbi:MAG: hypothetical protein AAFR64_01805 [Pseudomonadota bacterium]